MSIHVEYAPRILFILDGRPLRIQRGTVTLQFNTPAKIDNRYIEWFDTKGRHNHVVLRSVVYEVRIRLLRDGTNKRYLRLTCTS